jgi:nitrogen fixation NifU-like protein
MNTGLPSLDELYREVILDHYQSPRNRGRLADPDVANAGSNPLCGDEVELSLRIRDGQVTDVAFDGRGCSISQASASMMTEAIKGKPLEAVRAVLGEFKALMTDKNAEAVDAAALGDLEALQGVRRYPVRVKCALLPWNVLQESLELYRAGQARGGQHE